MTDNNKFLHWLTLEEGKTVKFSELAHLMAKAMHQGDDESFSYAAARINLEDELKQAVKDGSLMVRNPAGLGRHTFPHGAALQSAVLIPNIDLPSFLEARGMGLRLTPHGNGPVYWTLRNAANAIQTQEGWHDGAGESLRIKLCEAAAKGELAMRDPHTDLIEASGLVVDTWHFVAPADVNVWLEKQGVTYRWTPQGVAPKTQPKQASSSEWVSEAQSRAHEIIKEQRARDLYPDQLGIADQIAREFRAAGKVGADGKPISGAYIKRHALKGITSAIGKQLSTSKRQSK